MKKTLCVLCVAVLLLLPLSGCGKGSVPGEEGYRFTDALGQEIRVDNPQRVVALMGGFAETWLLAGGELVGVTADAVEERDLPLPENIAVVGTHINPSVEGILALNPDLVLLSSETAAQAALRESLSGAGVTAAYFSVTHFEDYLEMLRVCTEITGREDLYRQNGLDIQRQIEEITAENSEREGLDALLMITYSGGAAVQDSSTMTGGMLRELGCENLADKTPGLLREFSLEHILTEDPDYIFVISMGNDEELARKSLYETVESKPAWQELTAVKEGRYILLPKELFLYKPNARWAESYRYLAEILNNE